MLSPNYVEPPPSAWAKPPDGFAPHQITELPRINAGFTARVEESRRAFRIARPGCLLIGFERYKRFASALPPGLRLEAAPLIAALKAEGWEAS